MALRIGTKQSRNKCRYKVKSSYIGLAIFLALVVLVVFAVPDASNIIERFLLRSLAGLG